MAKKMLVFAINVVVVFLVVVIVWAFFTAASNVSGHGFCTDETGIVCPTQTPAGTAGAAEATALPAVVVTSAPPQPYPGPEPYPGPSFATGGRPGHLRMFFSIVLRHVAGR